MRLAMVMLIAIWMPLGGCGTSSGDLDMGAGDGAPCVGPNDCASADFVCAYAIADGCAAKGHCSRVATPTCQLIQGLCGCDGSVVATGTCFYPAGYAGGPTNGQPICGDGGL